MAKALTPLGSTRLTPSASSALNKSPAKQKGLKKAAKHAAKKAAKKASRKASEGGERRTHPAAEQERDLARAYHHLQRAWLVISLVEQDSGDDFRALLQHGIELYEDALREQRRGRKVRSNSAVGVLRAAEHLSMASFYSAREDYRLPVLTPELGTQEELHASLRRKLEKSKVSKESPEQLKALALELLRRSEAAGDDPHLSWELLMAAEGLWSAIEGEE